MPERDTSVLPFLLPVRSFRGRIGPAAGGGYYPAPGRYELHLTPSCPGCLRIAVTHALLGLDEALPLHLLPPLPDGPAGYAALRPAYRRSWHGDAGPAAAPVLLDRWTGRIVSNHAPHIRRDLARWFGHLGESGEADGLELRPRQAESTIAALEARCDRDLAQAAQRAGRAGARPAAAAGALRRLFDALGEFEGRLAHRPYLVGETLTAGDVHLWVTLVELDTVHRWHLDAEAVRRIADHPRVWAYARRLRDLPAFRRHLRLTEIARRHHAACRGLEAAGAAVPVIDWNGTEVATGAPPRA